MPYPASKYTYRIEWSEEDQAHHPAHLLSKPLSTAKGPVS
jgi:hypothetical protein